MQVENTTIFLDTPTQIFSDTCRDVKAPPYSSIESLMESLKNHGPLVAEGKLGPQAYSCAPFKLNKLISGQSIYGWRPGAAKVYSATIPIILVGARVESEKSHVFYVLAQDVTPSSESLIKRYNPSSLDRKVYVISYSNFLNRALVDLHPNCLYAEELYLNMDVNSILDNGEVEKKCKEIGQEIFDHYKSQGIDDSQRGWDAALRICEAAKIFGSNGRTRMRHIEYAWDGIGDENVRWSH